MADKALITRLPHLPAQLIYAAVFSNVKNSAFLRQQLIDCNADFEYAFLDASAILSINHVLAACFRAMNDAAHSRLKSRNVHSEIVFALNPSNNIAESFRRFGVQDSTTSLIAIKVVAVPEGSPEEQNAVTAIAQHLQTNVQGEAVPFTDETLTDISDVDRIRKIYKAPLPQLPKGSKINNGTASLPSQTRELEAILLGSMAIKGS